MAVAAPREITLRTGETALIRTTAREDAEAVIALQLQAARDGAITYAEEDELPSALPAMEDLLDTYARQPGCLHLVAEARGAIVGVVDLANGGRRRLAHTGQVSLLVARAWRGKGVGRGLMTALLDWAAEGPVERVSLWVLAGNEPAIALYTRLGFVVAGRLQDDVKLAEGRYLDSILMSRPARLPHGSG